MFSDIRFALRQLTKSRGFTVVSVLTLALGIGACTAIFSVVNGVLLRPLDYPQPERLMIVRETNLPQFPEFSVSPPNFIDWRKQAKSFDSIAATRGQSYNLTGNDEPIRVAGARVSTDFFRVYGVKPQLGRDFLPTEDSVEPAKVVLLSHGFWQRQFGGTPDIVGRTLQLNDVPHTVIGVMPAGFQRSSTTELWAPLGLSSDELTNDNRGAHYLGVVARLKPGVTAAQAQSEMNVMAAQFGEQYPDSNKGWGVKVISLADYGVRNVRSVLYTLLGAVGCVLLIACANVANLLLARATTRLREISIRSALGASRGRIIRQLLTESLVLFLLGGLLGLLVAKWGLDALLALAPTELPRANEIKLDAGALTFTLSLSLLTGLIFGLIPAWQATRLNLTEAMKEGARGATDAGRSWLRNSLVVGEVALALLLLAGAGLLGRSFLKLSAVNPGFEPTHAITLSLALPKGKYSKPEQQVAFAQQLIANLRSLPGVQAVGATHTLPLVNDWVLGFTIEGRPPLAPSDLPNTNFFAITPDYPKAMGIRLLRGRLFTEQDNDKAPHVALINETMARQYFPNEEPLGKRISVTNGPDTWREIVGIVNDITQYGVDHPPMPQSYEPLAQKSFPNLTMVIRTAGDPKSISSLLRAQVFAVDKNQPVTSIKPLEEIVAGMIAQEKFAMILLTVFSLVALVIAAVGIYGVMAYTVTQRTGEIGIRMALGASQGSVLQLILRSGMKIISIGLALGLGATLALAHVMQSLLYGTSSRDPLTLSAIALILASVAFVACLIPALRATRVDPLVALRNE